jgi:hypothetical protein
MRVVVPSDELTCRSAVGYYCPFVECGSKALGDSYAGVTTRRPFVSGRQVSGRLALDVDDNRETTRGGAFDSPIVNGGQVVSVCPTT